MSNNNNSVSTGGIGFFGLLAIAFIVLKLTGFIDWEWWIVLSPIWGSALLVFVVFVVLVILDRKL